jgi:hypothetical protein
LGDLIRGLGQSKDIGAESKRETGRQRLQP